MPCRMCRFVCSYHLLCTTPAATFTKTVAGPWKVISLYSESKPTSEPEGSVPPAIPPSPPVLVA
jgi:hypothetical protein